MSHSSLLSLALFPKAILHIDADAFFASCEQSRDPALRGKPVITGRERGIASSMSYEAKALGVTRGMPLHEILKICPEAIILPSDYETYSLLSKRMFGIVRRYTPDVEEYSIDECFADLTGLRRVYRTSYKKIAQRIKSDLDTELGFTFSIGLAPSKVLAKVASKWQKPSGLTSISARHAHEYLVQIPVSNLWGVGPATTAYLLKYGVHTALEFAQLDERWIKHNLSKPYYEIWQEIRGKSIMAMNLEEKSIYTSIQKFKTFTPPSNHREFVFSQLSKNIENACMKARRYNLVTKEAIFVLRTQDFRHFGVQIKLEKPTNFSHKLIHAAQTVFDKLFVENQLFRQSGVVLNKLSLENNSQLDLFGSYLQIDSIKQIYNSVDSLRNKYGKHTLFLGSSFTANHFGQHLTQRGSRPTRHNDLLTGETSRKRLAVPRLMNKLV